MVRTFNTRYGFIRQSTAPIMLIEDDLDHAELIMRTVAECTMPDQVIHFHDGHSALDYLFRRNQFADLISMPHPQLILLDVNLPGMHGIDILRTIKKSDELRMMPVVMLTTSATEQDIWRAYRYHANSYIVKPVGCDEFKELMHTLCAYWLGSNKIVNVQEVISEIQAS